MFQTPVLSNSQFFTYRFEAFPFTGLSLQKHPFPIFDFTLFHMSVVISGFSPPELMALFFTVQLCFLWIVLIVNFVMFHDRTLTHGGMNVVGGF